MEISLGDYSVIILAGQKGLFERPYLLLLSLCFRFKPPFVYLEMISSSQISHL